jgi:hypothetical protein
MHRWFGFLIVLLVLMMGLIGFEVWLLKQLPNNKIVQSGSSDSLYEAGVGCEWEKKIYKPKDQFLIWIGDGCGLCFCSEDGIINCEKVNCPEGGRND